MPVRIGTRDAEARNAERVLSKVIMMRYTPSSISAEDAPY
jgi:hypothetical protein